MEPTLPPVGSGSQPSQPNAPISKEEQLDRAIIRSGTRKLNDEERTLLEQDCLEIANLAISGVSVYRDGDHGFNLAKRLYENSTTHKFIYNLVVDLGIAKWLFL